MSKEKETDEQLAVMLQKGNKDAFGQLIDRYEPALLRYTHRLLSDQDAAEDVTQETFLKSYRDIQGFDPNRKFSSWLYRIAHNQAIDAIRKRKGTVILEEAESIASEEDIHDDIQNRLDKKHLRTKLDTAIAKIPTKYRETVILRFYEEKEYDEIAEILHLPIGTVGTYISRAKAELRKQLTEINIEDYL